MSSTFGATLSGTSSATLVMDVSADGEAFTGSFADFQAEANNRAGRRRRWRRVGSGSCSRWSTSQGDSINVRVSGQVITEDAVRDTLMISVNGQGTVIGFPPSSDEGFVRSVRYLTSGFDTEFPLAVSLVVEGGSQSGSTASVTVDAVNAEIGLNPSEPGDVESAAASA